MSEIVQSPYEKPARLAAILRASARAALLLSLIVFFFGCAPNLALKAAAVPEEKTIKSSLSTGSWLEEAFDCAVKINEVSERSEAFIAVIEAMDGPQLEKNYACLVSAARGLEDAFYTKRVMIALMQALARAGMYDVACDTLKQFKEQPDVYGGLKYIIEQQARAGLYDLALGMVAMIDYDSNKCRLTAIVAGIMAEAGKYEDALKLAETIKEETCRMRAVILVGKAYFAAGDVKSCKKMFVAAEKLARMIKCRPEDSLCEVAMAQIEAGLWEDAWGIIQGVEYGSDKNKIIRMILQEAIDAGKSDVALKIAQTTMCDAERNKCLMNIVEAQVRAGQKAAAQKTLAEVMPLMRKTVYQGRGAVVSALAALGRVNGLVGNKKEAAEIFAEAIKIALDADPKSKCGDYLKILVEAQVEAGMTDEALAVVRKCKEAVVRVKLLEAISRMQIVVEQIAEAEKTAIKLEKAVEETKNDSEEHVYQIAKQDVSFIYRTIACAWVAAGEIDKALAHLSRFKEGGDVGRILFEVGQHHARTGKADEAAKMYHKALEAIYAGDHRFLDGLLEDVAGGYMELGMFEQAVAIARRMNSKANLMTRVAERMASARRTKEVVDVYEQIKGEPDLVKAWYCIGVARGLASTEKTAEKDAEDKP